MIQLRDYQENLITGIRGQFLQGHKQVLAVSPTGSGKTATMAAMTHRSLARGHTCLFTVHREELLKQTIDAFNEEGVPHGIISAGYDMDLSKPVQIASIDTLRRRLGKIDFKPSFVLVDEAAHSCSETWQHVIWFYREAYTVGLTATPERLDGRGLGNIYKSMVEGPTTKWLIDNGYLSRYELFCPDAPDLSGIAHRCGDFNTDQISGIMDRPKITGDAIREYQRHCPGRRAIAFCASIEHSQHVAQQFRDSGIVALHIDGKTPEAVRSAAVSDFRSGIIKVLTSVDIFSEGFDVPAVEASILLRPTESLSLYLQQVGRSLRKFDGKDRAVILDHAGNVNRHYLPDEERVWSLQGRQKKTKSERELEAKTKIRQCPECYLSHRPSDTCPYCSHEYESHGRQIQHVDGDLVLFEPGVKKKEPKKFDSEISSAETIEDFERIAIARGYSSPTRWAEIRHAARNNRKPNFAKAMARRTLYA